MILRLVIAAPVAGRGLVLLVKGFHEVDAAEVLVHGLVSALHVLDRALRVGAQVLYAGVLGPCGGPAGLADGQGHGLVRAVQLDQRRARRDDRLVEEAAVLPVPLGAQGEVQRHLPVGANEGEVRVQVDEKVAPLAVDDLGHFADGLHELAAELPRLRRVGLAEDARVEGHRDGDVVHAPRLEGLQQLLHGRGQMLRPPVVLVSRQRLVPDADPELHALLVEALKGVRHLGGAAAIRHLGELVVRHVRQHVLDAGLHQGLQVVSVVVPHAGGAHAQLRKLFGCDLRIERLLLLREHEARAHLELRVRGGAGGGALARALGGLRGWRSVGRLAASAALLGEVLPNLFAGLLERLALLVHQELNALAARVLSRFGVPRGPALGASVGGFLCFRLVVVRARVVEGISAQL
mmetsp:Transcript_59486/g.184551  ORF Transcript_59486/g.184551 Transcript_59486/m.184551 type:complete len:407 (+) Transcript_59486:1003-2223(+)